MKFVRPRVADRENETGGPPFLFVLLATEGADGTGDEHAEETEVVACGDGWAAGGRVLAEDCAVGACVVEVSGVVEGAFEVEVAVVLVVEKFEETL